MRMLAMAARCAATGLMFSAVALTAQGAPEHGAFIVRKGADTVVVERFDRAGDTLRESIRVQGQPRLDYTATLRRDQSIATLSIAVFAADAAPDAVPIRKAVLSIHHDSVVADIGGTTQRFPIAAGAGPLINNSWASLELATRRARAAGTALTLPVWTLANASPLTLVVTPVGADSMVVAVAGQEERFRVDAAGRIQGGALAAQGLEILRVSGATGAEPSAGGRPALTALPAGVIERDVTVPGPVPLPAMLTLPAGPGPFPAVVLVHGSGPGDRDETLLQNKPFRDLAWGLAQHGVAVLRYDKRADVQPSWYVGKTFTVYDEVIQDALSALALVRQQPEVDPVHTYNLGLSLGGMLAPRIAKADGKVAGVIIMAGATRVHLMDQMDRQMAYLQSISGADSDRVKQQRAAFAPAIAAVAALRPADSTNPTPIAGLGGTGAHYWLDLNAYDPAATMREVHIPALVLQGMRDYQVLPDQLDDWLRAVGPRTDITVKRYPALNHIFMAGSGAPTPADYGTAGHVDPQVITDIAGWIHGH